MTEKTPDDVAKAAARLAETGRNDVCPCGSGKKYKKCHLRADEEATVTPEEAPDPKALIAQGWRLFEQRRPGAAEKQFRAALELDGTLADAQVGIAMAKLSAGDNDAAKQGFHAVIDGQSDLAARLGAEGVTDAFDKPEAQPFIRAAHALGCLCFDEEQYDDCTTALARVYAIDGGAVGTEARMVAAKAFIKLGRPADALSALQPAVGFVAAAPRAHMGMTLAHFLAGDTASAEKSLALALQGNPHLGKAVAGVTRVRVAHPAAAIPGSREEAAVYAQGFGDVWTEEAKTFLRVALDRQATGAGVSAGPTSKAAAAPSAENAG